MPQTQAVFTYRGWCTLAASGNSSWIPKEMHGQCDTNSESARRLQKVKLLPSLLVFPLWPLPYRQGYGHHSLSFWPGATLDVSLLTARTKVYLDNEYESKWITNLLARESSGCGVKMLSSWIDVQGESLTVPERFYQTLVVFEPSRWARSLQLIAAVGLDPTRRGS